MSNHLRRLAALALISWAPAFAVTPAKRNSAKPGAQTAASKKTPARRGAASKKKRGKSARAKSRQTWRTSQMTPAPERYKEIQTALDAKGYSTRTPDGVWTPEWAGALKRFQQDRKLEPTGKLNSLSLITLGLGPKRGAEAPPPPAAAPASSTPNSSVRILQ
jgi:peptidoglycan hydrolase-like protein with peptidoglycan-binding domain